MKLDRITLHNFSCSASPWPLGTKLKSHHKGTRCSGLIQTAITKNSPWLGPQYNTV